MADRPIDEIRAAFTRVHHVAIGKTTDAYMSIPADPKRDADLIISAAIDELAALRRTRDAYNCELVVHAQVDALKRRIAALRRALKDIELGRRFVPGAGDTALYVDDAARRRFEAKQRKAVRR